MCILQSALPHWLRLVGFFMAWLETKPEFVMAWFGTLWRVLRHEGNNFSNSCWIAWHFGGLLRTVYGTCIESIRTVHSWNILRLRNTRWQTRWEVDKTLVTLPPTQVILRFLQRAEHRADALASVWVGPAAGYSGAGFFVHSSDWI